MLSIYRNYDIGRHIHTEHLSSREIDGDLEHRNQIYTEKIEFDVI